MVISSSLASLVVNLQMCKRIFDIWNDFPAFFIRIIFATKKPVYPKKTRGKPAQTTAMDVNFRFWGGKK